MVINAEHVPELNRLTVLKNINQKEPFTRMDVVRRANLSLPTVNNILLDLIAHGYVTEIGSDKSRGGRPPTLFQFNPAVRYAIGIEIQIPKISIGLVNLQQELIALAEYDFSDQTTAEGVLQTLHTGVSRILAMSAIDATRLIGIGLGLPGFVDKATGLWLRYTRLPQLKDVPVGEALAAQFGAPIYTQNESNVYALAELRYGNLPLHGDTIFINCSEGVKASVVVDGQILAGRYGNFGAIGHFIVVENGRPCYCGARGCLEMYASGYAFREALRLKAGPNSDLRPEELFRRAGAGDPLCREIVDEAIPHTAYAFASLTRVTDIYQVVLLGAYAAGGDYLLNRLYDGMAERLPGVSKRNLSLRLGSNHAIEKIVVAAAAPVIEHHFSFHSQ